MNMPPHDVCDYLVELMLNGGSRYATKETATRMASMSDFVHTIKMAHSAWMIELTPRGSEVARLYMRSWGSPGLGWPSGVGLMVRSINRARPIKMGNEEFVRAIRECFELTGGRPPEVTYEPGGVRIKMFGLRGALMVLAYEPREKWTPRMEKVWDGFLRDIADDVGDYYTEVLKWEEH